MIFWDKPMQSIGKTHIGQIQMRLNAQHDISAVNLFGTTRSSRHDVD